MNPQRLLWLFIPLALLCGLSLGLYFAWQELAATPANATPAQLRLGEKEVYIRLVASAYAEEQDLRQAHLRLDNLKAGRVAQWVAELALQARLNEELDSAGRLAKLALALGINDPEIVALTGSTDNIPVYLSWQVLAQETLSCKDFPLGNEAMLVIQAFEHDEEPLKGATIELVAKDTQEVLSLRTDGSGQAIMPLRSEWQLTLSDEESLPLKTEELSADCTTAEQDAPHAFRISLQPSDQ